MKIYLVIEYNDEHYAIVAAFNSDEKAQKYANSKNSLRHDYDDDYYNVIEMELQ